MQVATTMAEKARMAAEQKVLDWSQRFPIKVAGWAARRAAWGAAAAAKEEAQFAEEEARWAAFKGREWALARASTLVDCIRGPGRHGSTNQSFATLSHSSATKSMSTTYFSTTA